MHQTNIYWMLNVVFLGASYFHRSELFPSEWAIPITNIVIRWFVNSIIIRVTHASVLPWLNVLKGACCHAVQSVLFLLNRLSSKYSASSLDADLQSMYVQCKLLSADSWNVSNEIVVGYLLVTASCEYQFGSWTADCGHTFHLSVVAEWPSHGTWALNDTFMNEMSDQTFQELMTDSQ